MSENPHNVTAAQAEVDAARKQLFGTLAIVQDRLRPSHLAQDAVESAAHGVANVVRKGTEAVRSRPLAAAGFAGMVGLILSRGWIADIVRGRDETPAAPDGLKKKPAKAATKGSSK